MLPTTALEVKWTNPIVGFEKTSFQVGTVSLYIKVNGAVIFFFFQNVTRFQTPLSITLVRFGQSLTQKLFRNVLNSISAILGIGTLTSKDTIYTSFIYFNSNSRPLAKMRTLMPVYMVWQNPPGGSQIWIGRGCAAGSSGPIPMFIGNFSEKGTHV